MHTSPQPRQAGAVLRLTPLRGRPERGYTACGTTPFDTVLHSGMPPCQVLLLHRGEGLCQGTASQLAEEVPVGSIWVERRFSAASKVLSFCHSERALAREESAFPTFSAASSAVPLGRLLSPPRADFRPRGVHCPVFLPGPYSAKVCIAIVVWVCLAILATLPAQAANPPQTQDKPSEAAAKTQPTQSFDLSDEVVRDVLTNLQRGIESHDIDRVLEIFDQQNMKDYAQFRDQMVAFFRRYDSVKFRYQLLQVTSDKDGGFATADIDMDADPSDILPTPQRRSTQMRFQMKRSPKGWKVVALRPADFFNQ